MHVFCFCFFEVVVWKLQTIHLLRSWVRAPESGSAFFFFFFLYNETWNLVRPVSDFACMHTSPHTSSPTPTSFSAPPGFRLEPVSVVRCHRERQRDTGDRGRCVEHEQSLFTRLWVKFCGFFKCLKAKKIKCKHMNQSNINNLTNPVRPFKCCRTLLPRVPV